METEEFDDDLTDDDGVAAQCTRGKAELRQIVAQARQALAGHGIDIPLFFLIPNSGEAVITFGTPGDSPDDEWNRVGELIEAVVRQSVGLDRTHCREVVCAITDPIAAPISTDPQ